MSKRSRMFAAVGLGLIVLGCRAMPSSSDRVAETIRIVTKSNGREGLFGVLIDGGIASTSADQHVEIIPQQSRETFHVVMTRKDIAGLVHDSSVATGETWVFTATAADISASTKLDGNVVIEFKNATIFPGLAGAEKKLGRFNLDLPAFPWDETGRM